MEMDPRTFRKAMGCFPTGVTVATTSAPDGEPVGVTVSSFTSVSLEPPLVMFCLDKKTTSLESFKKSLFFAVNVLRAEQKDLSIRFASRMADKWAGLTYQKGASGAPILPNCLAVYDCKLEAVHDIGDHLVFVGGIIHLDYDAGGQPLVFFRGNYAEII
jgi:flavin reductase (DIM6/NTAB) family NADH-FMN oxidoreductase RutF